MVDLHAETTGERLDRYLAEQLPDLSRSRLQKLIEQGNVHVNGEVCTSKKAVVQQGDWIQIEVPDAQPLALLPQEMSLDILYEDESLLILNKPTN